MLQDQMAQLKAAFPAEALSKDVSRGFELTSIRAAFVIERLNDVFGPCGVGWRYVHSPFEEQDGEIVTEVAFQYLVEGNSATAVAWDAEGGDWQYLPDTPGWSWPVFAAGGKKIGKGGAPLTDPRKSAVTDGLTKAASMIGVGHEVFKGLVRVGRETKPNPPEPSISRPTPDASTQGNGPANAQSFWKLANQAIDAGVNHERIRAIAATANGKGWVGAINTLRAVMAKMA